MAKDRYGQEIQPEVTTGTPLPPIGSTGTPQAGAYQTPVIQMMPGTENMQGMSMTPGQRNDELRRAQFIRPIDTEQLRKWTEALNRYKSAKHKLDVRIIDAEDWWRQRNEFAEAKVSDAGDSDWEFRSKSSWLFNVIASKHADYLEAYPQPNFLPRAEDDKAEAYMLSKIVPVILKQNKFETVYDMAGWQKLKTGTGIYKVIWDKNKSHGLGDVSIVQRSLLNVFWEPGITDIQQSKYLFDVEVVDKETLIDEYPELKDQELSSAFVPEKIRTEEMESGTDKVSVIEVYYKRRGKLHYAKFVGEHVLYATENDNEVLDTQRDPMTGIISGVHTRAADGLYDHGLYPYVFDALFPVEGSPAGFGFVDLCANAATRIDKLDQAMLENAVMGATPRFFARTDGQVNMDEFLNVKKKIVHVPGNIDESALRLIETPQLSGNHIAVHDSFIKELRETSGNTEAGNGIASSGVTAASAYAALQEASGKLSRASTLATYRAVGDVCFLVKELIRQFFVLPRQFRIIGARGAEKFVSFSNEGMVPQWQGMIGGQDMGYRIPEYDIDIVPEKRSSYTRIANNELAMELYGKGFFNPQLTDQALATLDMMDFDQKDEIMQKVAQNGTMFDQLRQWQQLALQMAAQFRPDMVQGLADTINGSGMPGAGAAISEETAKAGAGITGEIGKQEPAIVERARQRTNEVSQPGGSGK